MPIMPARTLDQVDCWIFDLDNTLYPASCNLFAQVDQRITSFIADHFNISSEEARALQKQYFRDHGTTLRGLMVEHDINPIPFLDYVHAIDVTPVSPTPELAAALLRLPGRRLIYTNGSEQHARNVTDRLGITACFDGVFDIVAAGYVPKPDPRPYQQMVEQFAIDPARACMVEDIARNLVPAHALGMVTVWVDGDSEWSHPDRSAIGTGDHIDVVIRDLPGWLKTVAVSAD